MNLSKNQKVITGVGIAGGIGVLYLLLKNRFGFGDTPVELWRRTSAPTRSTIAHNRAEARDLQSVAKARTQWARIEAEKKQRRKDAETAAKARKREARWRRVRRKIESN